MTKTLTVRGRLRDGTIELLEPLDAPDGSAVQISYEIAVLPATRRPMRAYYGMFAKPGAPTSDEADWQEAKQMWEPRDR